MLGAGGLAYLKLGPRRDGKQTVGFAVQVRFVFAVRFEWLKVICRFCCWSLRCL